MMASPCDDRRDPRAMTLLGHIAASEEGAGANNNDMNVKIGMPTDATKIAGVSGLRRSYPRCDVDATRCETPHQIVGTAMITDDRHSKIAGLGGYARFI
ncbi:hypothetical protein PAC1_06875 [Cutibacterium acnes C1]|nr:hypothetical protein PAC1_06875 [Cutibacterium acnes C1]EFS87448.1 hypothetical protein HMPREF9603_00964 [Cutibacterium acnes HL001PA1]KEY36638.1 hypothetical protein FB33_1953 [Cutibacterium acnes]